MIAVRNIGRYTMGAGSISALDSVVDKRRAMAREEGTSDSAVFFVDEYFSRNPAPLAALHPRPQDVVRYVGTAIEPTTEGIDHLCADVRSPEVSRPCAIVGIGGGITLDTAKAVANLLTNPGPAASYQGWDLVRNPAVYKIGVPTISGTGAESSRTCVMTNADSGLKLGMNSDFTLYDELILDHELTATVDRAQYFYTGMDTYIHCIESLNGSHRNPIGDALSSAALELCRQVFFSSDMMSPGNRERLMTASLLGGQAIAMGIVGVVHPCSAALSVVLGTHHCVANCIVMRVMDDFYPDAAFEFRAMAATQGVMIPSGICADLGEEDYSRLHAATTIHAKPLTNALGDRFMDVLPLARVSSLFRAM